MSSTDLSSPFQELPEALVDDMLSYHSKIGRQLSESFEKVQHSKTDIRNSLNSLGLLKHDSEIIASYINPTTCGIDGAYAIERLLSTDIAAMAGIAVEGLSPPTEKRYWPTPRYRSNIIPCNHNDATFLAVRAIMITMELELAAEAPHDVVFLDGSLTTPVIHFNQAFSRINEKPQDLSSILLDRIGGALEAYKKILTSSRSDKIFAGVPKYTTRNEVATKLGLAGHEDRSLLSFVLRGGELIGACPMLQPSDSWNFVGLPDNMVHLGDDIISLAKEMKIIYYRPYEYFPALRVEVAPTVTANQSRLSILLESLRLQCGSAVIMEPYPLYMADRMVKHLGTALPAIRRATTQEMAASNEDVGSVYLAMYGYRTESGM